MTYVLQIQFLAWVFCQPTINASKFLEKTATSMINPARGSLCVPSLWGHVINGSNHAQSAHRLIRVFVRLQHSEPILLATGMEKSKNH